MRVSEEYFEQYGDNIFLRPKLAENNFFLAFSLTCVYNNTI